MMRLIWQTMISRRRMTVRNRSNSRLQHSGERWWQRWPHCRRSFSRATAKFSPKSTPAQILMSKQALLIPSCSYILYLRYFGETQILQILWWLLLPIKFHPQIFFFIRIHSIGKILGNLENIIVKIFLSCYPWNIRPCIVNILHDSSRIHICVNKNYLKSRQPKPFITTHVCCCSPVYISS